MITGKERISAKAGCLILVAIFGSVVAIAGYIAEHPSKPEPELPVEVKIAGLDVLVTPLAQGSVSWRCDFAINGDYELRGIVFSGHATKGFHQAAFAQRDGLRFDPFRYRLQSVDVECQTPQGVQRAHFAH